MNPFKLVLEIGYGVRFIEFANDYFIFLNKNIFFNFINFIFLNKNIFFNFINFIFLNKNIFFNFINFIFRK